MNEWILFTIGLFIGSMCGVMTVALISGRRYDNMSREIQDLRTQRKLLKDELLKGQAKPKPRNRRIATHKRKKRI
jgi:uncharacterized membrane-anchored protein YhcB (DUF1043 family)